MSMITLFANARDARNASRCHQVVAVEDGFVGCNGVLLNGKTVIIDAKGIEFVVDASGSEHISDALRKARVLQSAR